MICLERINSDRDNGGSQGVVGINGKDIMIEHRMGKIAVKDRFGEKVCWPRRMPWKECLMTGRFLLSRARKIIFNY